jgi:hypothetical protein
MLVTRSQNYLRSKISRMLLSMGYWTGAVDGLFDPATRSA